MTTGGRGAANKLVDEYLIGVVTNKYPVLSSDFGQHSILEADATTSLHKVRNLRGEQKELESSARDRESRVCQVSQTLSFVC